MTTSGHHKPSCHELKEDFKEPLKSARFWIEGVGVFALGIFGLTGNLLTIVTLCLLKSNKSFNKLLISLAITDSLLILELILEMSVTGVFILEEPLWFKLIYPHIVHPVRGIIQTADIFMMVAVSAERYKAICQPLNPRQPYYMYLAIVVLTSITLEFPRFFEFELNYDKTDYWTSNLMENIIYIQMNSYWNELIVSGIFPIAALVYMNLQIHLKISASSRFTKRFTGASSSCPRTTSDVCDDEMTTEATGSRLSRSKSRTLMGENGQSNLQKNTEKKNKLLSSNHQLPKYTTKCSSRQLELDSCSSSGTVKDLSCQRLFRKSYSPREKRSARMKKPLLSTSNDSSEEANFQQTAAAKQLSISCFKGTADTKQLSRSGFTGTPDDEELLTSSFEEMSAVRFSEQEHRFGFWKALNEVKSRSNILMKNRPILNSHSDSSEESKEIIRSNTTESELSNLAYCCYNKKVTDRHLATVEDLFDDCTDFEQLINSTEQLQPDDYAASQQWSADEQFCLAEHQQSKKTAPNVSFDRSDYGQLHFTSLRSNHSEKQEDGGRLKEASDLNIFLKEEIPIQVLRRQNEFRERRMSREELSSLIARRSDTTPSSKKIVLRPTSSKRPSKEERSYQGNNKKLVPCPRTQLIRRRREKSTIILVSVVLVFIMCHTYRLAFRAFELAFPEKAVLENFYMCDQEGRYHVPVIFYILANLHYLFLTINSSVNFIIYCCVGKEFRKNLKELLHF